METKRAVKRPQSFRGLEFRLLPASLLSPHSSQPAGGDNLQRQLVYRLRLRGISVLGRDLGAFELFRFDQHRAMGAVFPRRRYSSRKSCEARAISPAASRQRSDKSFSQFGDTFNRLFPLRSAAAPHKGGVAYSTPHAGHFPDTPRKEFCAGNVHHPGEIRMAFLRNVQLLACRPASPSKSRKCTFGRV